MLRVAPLALAVVAACGGDDPPAERIDVSRPECENLNPRACMAPWPSSRYLGAGGIEIPPEAMVVNDDGRAASPAPFERFDGFSLHTAAVTVVPADVDPAPLADETRIAESVLDGSPTVIVDAETGARVPHFAELDGWEGPAGDRVALYLRPIRPYEEARRYVVAIRGLSHGDGAPLEPSPYFRALRDGVATDVAELEGRRAHFEEVFSVLATAGVERDALIEAWDFRTGTYASYRRDMLHVIEDARGRIGDSGLGCTVTDVQVDFDHAELAIRVDGTMAIPLYVEDEAPGSPFVRGPDGLPAFQRMGEARFVFVVPYSVRDRMEVGGPPAPLVLFGHGLLGDRTGVASDLDEDSLRGNSRIGPVLARAEMVAVATDFWGLTRDDTEALGAAIADLDGFGHVPERLIQGTVSFLTLEKSFGGGGACSDLAELRVDGRSPIDPTTTHYAGVSGGALTGTTFAAFSDIERYGLVTGGASYTLMTSRSFAFFPFNLVLNASYGDKIARDVHLVMLASLWDQFDPATYAPLVLREPLPGAPERRVLSMIGVHDALVSNVASDFAARALGLSLQRPASREPYDIPTLEGPAPSAYTVFDLGVEPLTPGTRQPTDNGVHGSLLSGDPAIEQLATFLREGEVRSFCDGACDPE